MYYYICVFDMDQRHRKFSRLMNEMFDNNFCLITNSKNNINEDMKVEYIPFNYTSGKGYFSKITSLIKASRKLRSLLSNVSDNIYICDSLLSLLFFRFVLLKGFKKKKVIYYVPDIPNDSFDNRPGVRNKLLFILITILEKKLLQDIKFYIITSEGYLEYYLKLKEKDTRYLVLENKPSYADVKTVLTTTNKNIDINDGKKIKIGYFGIIRYKEILLNLIEVANSLNVNVVIAGKCDFINDLLVYSNVEWLGEFDYRDISTLYDKVDVSLAMYDRKMLNVRLALPNKLYESMIYRKPLIVSNNTYLSNIVRKENLGFEVDPYDKQNIRTLLDYLNSVNGKKELKLISSNLIDINQSLYFESQSYNFKKFIEEVVSNR